jgi:hypothetical protein
MVFSGTLARGFLTANAAPATSKREVSEAQMATSKESFKTPKVKTINTTSKPSNKTVLKVKVKA